MTRRMSPGLQEFQIGRMLAGTRWDSEVYDIRANLDRTLTYNENAANIRHQLGISTRNRGMEHLHQRKEERARSHQRRLDPLRQTGQIQGPIGLHIDSLIQAQRPGKRISRSGHRYYERRENRSDRGKLL